MASVGLVYLIVGLPAAGKTTKAKELEAAQPALRLTPDDWQIALFDGQNPMDQRFHVEGQLVQLGLRAARLGIDVIFDFGLWSKDERSALRWLAQEFGLPIKVIYVPIDPREQFRRVQRRFASSPEQTFPMSDAELTRWREQFQAPDDEELHGGPIPPVPPGHATWSQWASKQWPSLPDFFPAA